VETNIITLLSIIVTLGVAYSFYSIYNVTNEFESLKAKNRSTENKIENESKSLAERSIALDRKIELYRLNSKADTDFRNRKFLRALKNEIEILKFILQNEKYLNGTLLNSTNEFRSSIGIKRSFIANNILKCMAHLTNDKVYKFKGKELSDTIESIHFAVHTIKYRESLWSLIPKAEQERYSFLFNTVDQLLELIIRRELPYDKDINESLCYKLHYYHEGIINGEIEDNEDAITQWINDFKNKQKVDFKRQNDSERYY